MGFVNFLKGITAQVNPFDNGKTYGSYNPPKKKLQPGDPGYTAPNIRPAGQAPNLQAPTNPLKVQSPQNLFAGLNNNLKLPGAPPNPSITVNPNTNLSPLVKPPQPGTVIQPNKPTPQPITAPAQPKPGWTPPAPGTHAVVAGTPGTYINGGFVPDNQPKPTGFWGHVGNGLKTAGQTAVGTVANIPEVGLAAGRAATGLVQGVTQLPHVVTAITATGTQKLNQALPNPITHAINTGAQGANTGVNAVTKVVDKPINFVNRGIDSAAQSYANHVNVGGGEGVYKTTQIPINVLAALLTAGGSTAAEGGAEAGNAGKLAQISRFFNKPLTSNPDNIIAKTSQAIGNKATPVVQTLNRPISSTASGITRLINGRTLPNIERGAVDAGETGNVLSDVGNTTQIPVGTGIDVNAPPTEGTPVPVTVNRPPAGRPIIEVGGDKPGAVNVPTPDQVAAQRAANNFKNQAPGRPAESIGGVLTDPSKIVTTADKTEAQNVLDDRLHSNQITEEEHKALSDQLSKVPAADAPVPKGQKIDVKQVDSIPVQNQTTIPAALPEVPGTVRPAAATAPVNAESQAVANAPVTAAPAALPKEVQAVLDNPKQFNKRQVAAARNQRKLARQMAKTQEDTAAAVDRIQTASPPGTSPEGFTDTGVFGQSASGGAYQKVGRASEMKQAVQETSQMSPGDVIKTARENQAATGSFNRRDVRNLMAMFENKRIPRGTAEYNEAKQILKEDGTVQAQSLALRGGNVIRRSANSDQLTSQFESKIYRLVDDPSKVDSNSFNEVDAAEQKFTQARDDATAAYNRFTEAPTHANAQTYHAAQDAADSADKEAKMTEFKVAQSVLKGNKDTKQVREIQKMAKNADLYQMDAVDASMLSGTGTFARNFVNSAIGGGEEGLFGGIASRVANKLTGESVGGGFGRGTLSGFGKGTRNIVDASKARASNAGKNPLEHIKNFATTGNQLGDSIIDSQINHNVIDHYTQELKGQGYKGQELNDRASVMARQDPDEVGKVYAGYARAAAGLGSGITKSSKVETIIRDGISNAISGGNPGQKSEIAAKLITRMTVGFPSAVGRTIVEGGKRATLGVPTALKLFSTAARNDPAVRAQLIKESIKQAGTGATTGAIFYKLGQEGLVTGSYPTDPAERARWQREGITENSIKIGDNYYQLPSYLGSAALPALFAATLGRNNGDVTKSAGEVVKGLPQILPTDQASNVLDWVNGKTNSGKFLTQTAASAVRAATPAGALLNQISKSFDSTENDTTSGTALQNFLDKVYSGIPGVNNAANIPDKKDDAGNVLHNPSALPLAFGASSTEQGKGVDRTNALQSQVDNTAKALSDTGVLKDNNLRDVLDDKNLQIYKKVQAGEKVSQKEISSLQSALTKGVNGTSDTAYLERGQYDTNLTALKLKRTELAADKTTKPSDLAKVDIEIKRGQVYKDHQIPYSDITDYKSTSLADWRKMGDDTSDSYDPAEYQKLWAMDQLMTKAGASDNTKDPTAGKFSAKAPGKGSAGKVAGGWNAAFGTLKAGVGAPTVQNYQSINQQSGSVPVIQATRPNIVHKVSLSGGI